MKNLSKPDALLHYQPITRVSGSESIHNKLPINNPTQGKINGAGVVPATVDPSGGFLNIMMEPGVQNPETKAVTAEQFTLAPR